MIQVSNSIGVMGAGAWGTALALSAARAGRDVVLWGRDAAAMNTMAATRENARYLPGISLPPNLHPTADLAAFCDVPVILLVTPAQVMRESVRALLPHLAPEAALIICAKGIERASGKYLSQVVREEAPDHVIGALSGPGFAGDVGRGLPTAVTLAVPDQAVGERISQLLASSTFRLYWTDDLLGVEIGGAMKNVFAIAAGIVAGRGLGESARAALIARGFAELARLGRHAGAKPETFAGLSGLGDLVLTATSEQSRNLRFGLALGRGVTPAEALASVGTVEGAATACAAARLADEIGIDMPVTAAVASVIEGRDTIDNAIGQLMRRPLRAEV